MVSILAILMSLASAQRGMASQNHLPKGQLLQCGTLLYQLESVPPEGFDVATPEILEAEKRFLPLSAKGQSEATIPVHYVQHTRVLLSPNLQLYMQNIAPRHPEKAIPILLTVFKSARVFRSSDSAEDPFTDYTLSTVNYRATNTRGSAFQENYNQVLKILHDQLKVAVFEQSYQPDQEQGFISAWVIPAEIEELVRINSPSIGAIQLGKKGSKALRSDGTYVDLTDRVGLLGAISHFFKPRSP